MTQPIKEARKGGVVGFGKGIGKGILGLAFKPAAGAVDLVSSTMAGVGAEIGSKRKMRPRCRDPRHVPPNDVIDSYSVTRAKGAKFLAENFRGRYVSDLFVGHHVQPVRDAGGQIHYDVYIACLRRFLIIESKDIEKRNHSSTKVMLEIDPEMVQSYHLVPDGIELTFVDSGAIMVPCQTTATAAEVASLIDSIKSGHQAARPTGTGLKCLFDIPERASAEAAVKDQRAAALARPSRRDSEMAMETRQVRIREAQRRYPIKGWSDKLLPTDGGHAVHQSGLSHFKDGFKWKSIEAVPVEPGWSWTSNWEVAADHDGDKDGWTYAIDFGRKYTKKCGFMDCVRIRNLVRTMQRSSASIDAPAGADGNIRIFPPREAFSFSQPRVAAIFRNEDGSVKTWESITNETTA